MKYISLSFDDARSDTYNFAFPILKKYGIKATVNVISDYVIHPQNYSFALAPNAMTVEQLIDWQAAGFEIACHGRTHKNTAMDVIENIKDLKSFGIDTSEIGFASPNSELTKKNIRQTGIDELKKTSVIAYIRSGIKVRREGLMYIVGAGFEKITHSRSLYWLLNKRNIHQYGGAPELIASAAIKSYTTIRQIVYFLEKMKEGQAVVLMLHSILPKKIIGNSKDNYCWEAEKFEELCKYLSASQNIKAITTRELITGGFNGR